MILKILLKEFNVSVIEISKRIGKSRQTVYDLVNLNRLPNNDLLDKIIKSLGADILIEFTDGGYKYIIDFDLIEIHDETLFYYHVRNGRKTLINEFGFDHIYNYERSDFIGKTIAMIISITDKKIIIKK